MCINFRLYGLRRPYSKRLLRLPVDLDPANKNPARFFCYGDLKKSKAAVLVIVCVVFSSLFSKSRLKIASYKLGIGIKTVPLRFFLVTGKSAARREFFSAP